MKRVVALGILLSLGLAGADGLLHKHPHFPIEGTFAFHAVYSLLGCVALALGARALRPLLQRREDDDA